MASKSCRWGWASSVKEAASRRSTACWYVESTVSNVCSIGKLHFHGLSVLALHQAHHLALRLVQHGRAGSGQLGALFTKVEGLLEGDVGAPAEGRGRKRSEEHTSE